MPKREPTSAEYQAALDENDALRREIVRLRTELKQAIDLLELKERVREKRLGEKDDEIYALRIANRDLEVENADLKFDNKRLLERLTEQQQQIIDKLHQQVSIGKALAKS